MSRWMLTAGLGGLLVLTAILQASDPTPAERGKAALEGRAYIPGVIPPRMYQNVWRLWEEGRKEPPADFDAAVAERYGLHPAPYPNNGLPMGLRESVSLIGTRLIAFDCMLCHGGSIAGKSYVGLGNSTLDVQAFFEEVAAVDGERAQTPFRFGNVRGTSEAGAMAVFLLGYREPDLKLRPSRIDLDLHDDMCEDPPAWWLLKKKQTMYHTGGADAHSVRSLMQFMMSPLNPPFVFTKSEKDFRDIQAYLLSLEPPPYPETIDRQLATAGEKLFRRDCARCHGTYGKDGKYPNKIIPLEEIGTDRRRYEGITEKFGLYYNRSWFAQAEADGRGKAYPALPTPGYQAPPLDGVWATAPYFHNGSVPTVHGVLNSQSRPTVFTRSYRTGKEDYDWKQLGWKVQVLPANADEGLPPFEARKIYNTRKPGRGNGGHTFGDHLTEDERWAIIEYLKTL